MKKSNLNNHPLLRATNKKIRDTHGLHRPTIVFRGYVIESTIFIDSIIDNIIITHLFVCSDDDSREILSNKKMFNKLIELKDQFNGCKPYEARKLFYQDSYIKEKASNKIKQLKYILDSIGANKIANYESLFTTIEEFYETRNMVAHYKWGLISTGNEDPQIIYQRLSGEIEKSVDKEYINNFDFQFKKIKNNLSVVWITFFEKHRATLIS